MKNYTDYKSCVIYKGDCSWVSRYTGETKHDAEVRWNKHNNPTKCPESSNKPSKKYESMFLHELSFQMLQKMLRPGRTGNLILTKKRTVKD